VRRGFVSIFCKSLSNKTPAALFESYVFKITEHKHTFFITVQKYFQFCAFDFLKIHVTYFVSKELLLEPVFLTGSTFILNFWLHFWLRRLFRNSDYVNSKETFVFSWQLFLISNGNMAKTGTNLVLSELTNLHKSLSENTAIQRRYVYIRIWKSSSDFR